MASIGLYAGQGLTSAAIVWTPLVLASLWLCDRLDPRGESGLVVTLMVALLARWIAAAAVQIFIYQDSPGLFASDECQYELEARFAVEVLAGRLDRIPSELPAPGLVWVMAACYWVVGQEPLVPKFLVGLCGAWTAVLASLIARRLHAPPVVRRAGLFAALCPSLVLWSSLELKDTWTLCGVEVALLTWLLLRERFRPWLPILFVAGMALIAVNRPYETLFVGFAVAASVPIGLRRGRWSSALGAAALVAMCALVAQRINSVGLVAGPEDKSTSEQISQVRSAYSIDTGSGVDISTVDTSTPLGLIAWLPIGIAAMYLAPIPFTGGSTISLASSPEMLIWYAFLPSLFRGVWHWFRTGQRRVAAPLVFYLVIASVGWAIMVPNVGTLYRYRAQVLFVLLPFIAADQIRRRERIALGSRERAAARLVALQRAVGASVCFGEKPPRP